MIGRAAFNLLKDGVPAQGLSQQAEGRLTLLLKMLWQTEHRRRQNLFVPDMTNSMKVVNFVI
jgi:hypothetical protein